MLDLETMSSTPTATIIAIGAILFEAEGPYVSQPGSNPPGIEFYEKVSLDSSMQSGATVDASTILWWLQQSDESRQELLKGPHYNINEAMQHFGTWYKASGATHLWGHGSCFDEVILRNAYLRNATPIVWDFRNVMDTRTLFRATPGYGVEFKLSRDGKHIAIWDAWRQAQAVQWCFKKIRSLTPIPQEVAAQ